MRDELAIKVLLVDDQPMVGEAVRRMLADEPGVEFRYCPDPAQAIDAANDFKPTVILQDLVMPDIDGLQLVKYFRANAATRETPLVVLSSKEEPTVKARAFALGANDYLVKLPDKLEAALGEGQPPDFAFSVEISDYISEWALDGRLVDLTDAVEAEDMFTKLMGEEVEPRRQFIEDNALNVRNLDV